MVLEMVATIAAGFFAGGATFISVVEHPARLSGGTEFAIREFRPSFRRAHRLMAGLALASFVLGCAAWIKSLGLVWLLGGLLMVANGPWTVTLIRPLNKRLLDPHLDITSERAASLITRWGHYHWVRTLLGCLGFLLFVLGLGRS